jgi:hypothetical protein
MKRLITTACLACLTFVATAEIHTAPAAECCSCSGCPTCTPRWEDKKTKKPKYTMKCDDECVRGFDAWCDNGCCPENTSPCGEVFTKKKLFKREEDKVERVLKYDLTKADCQPCRPAPCNECGPCWCELRDLCRRLFTGW